jgi:hypothetical protein
MEAIGDPTIRVAFVRDGIEQSMRLGSPSTKAGGRMT